MEALHLFYDGVDLRADHEIEEVFAQDEVPAGLHFRDLEETELVHELDLRTFEEWLAEGRHNCDIAQAVLHAWTSTLRGSQDDTLHDLFSTLVAEFAAAKDDPDAGRSNMHLLDLSRWVLAHCQFASVLHAANAEDRASEIAEWIAEEIAVVSAYTSVWRGSSTLEGPPASDVIEDVFSQAARRVLPWPGISESPVPETTDGRIVKSHPLSAQLVAEISASRGCALISIRLIGRSIFSGISTAASCLLCAGNVLCGLALTQPCGSSRTPPVLCFTSAPTSKPSPKQT